MFWTGTAVHGHQDHTVQQVGTGHAIERHTVREIVRRSHRRRRPGATRQARKRLPAEVLTEDPWYWRAPTAAEIRVVIGKGSETGIPGAQAAHLVGVLPQNFRKYTASDDAASRQKMSFAMWHLLLHRAGVKFSTIVY